MKDFKSLLESIFDIPDSSDELSEELIKEFFDILKEIANDSKKGSNPKFVSYFKCSIPSLNIYCELNKEPLRTSLKKDECYVIISDDVGDGDMSFQIIKEYKTEPYSLLRYVWISKGNWINYYTFPGGYEQLKKWIKKNHPHLKIYILKLNKIYGL